MAAKEKRRYLIETYKTVYRLDGDLWFERIINEWYGMDIVEAYTPKGAIEEVVKKIFTDSVASYDSEVAYARAGERQNGDGYADSNGSYYAEVEIQVSRISKPISR